jgi:excisionase family DNA binding protein
MMNQVQQKRIITEDAPLLTVGQMAKLLQVPKSWLYSKARFRGPGAMPRVRVGRYLRFNLRSVMEWLRDKQEGVL